MSGKELLEGMSFVEERFIEEAENQTIGRANIPVRWFSTAACLCILLGLLLHGGSIREIVIDMHLSIEDTAIDETLAAEFTAQTQPENAESVTLRVTSATDAGLIATVAEPDDIFTEGQAVNVVLESDTRTQLAQDSTDPDRSFSVHVFPPGTLVRVEVVSYDAETATLIVKSIEPEND